MRHAGFPSHLLIADGSKMEIGKNYVKLVISSDRLELESSKMVNAYNGKHFTIEHFNFLFGELVWKNTTPKWVHLGKIVEVSEVEKKLIH